MMSRLLEGPIVWNILNLVYAQKLLEWRKNHRFERKFLQNRWQTRRLGLRHDQLRALELVQQSELSLETVSW